MAGGGPYLKNGNENELLTKPLERGSGSVLRRNVIKNGVLGIYTALFSPITSCVSSLVLNHRHSKMASTPPSYTSSASVSRAKTSPGEIRSLADSMLRSSISRNVSSPSSPSSSSSISSVSTVLPSYPGQHSASSATVPRPPGMSMADSMLRSSLSRSISTSSSASVSRSSASPDDIRSLADQLLRSSVTRSVSSASSASSVSSVSTSSPSYTSNSPHSPRFPADSSKLNREKTRPPIVGSSPSWGESSTAISASSRISSAESKLRVRQLQQEVERAKAQAPKYDTKGLFKAATSTDLLFLIDTTRSMNSYIEEAKKQVKNIVDDIKKTFLHESEVRVAVVGYKDHSDSPNIEFLDFTPAADNVRRFLDTLVASGGGDIPEDVLGGVRQALNASWKQQTRCIIHITDAPGHSRALHDLPESYDDYFISGSEPHRLTYQPLFRQLIQLNINYALLRIDSITDRMALAFSQVYAAAKADAKLLPSNPYYGQANSLDAKIGGGLWGKSSMRGGGASAELQFEEMQLGTTYSQLRHLVVRTVTSSVTRTAGRLSLALGSKASTGAVECERFATKDLGAISEDEDSGGGTVTVVPLETTSPQWENPGWLNETLEVEGFCPEVVVHNASTLNDMMELDENIKLGVIQLTVHARSKPFAKGSVRTASYARTPASTSRFVVKSFIEDGYGLAHMVEDMRIQALCKAFALEFNGLLKTEHPLDFVVTTCLQSKSSVASETGFRSLEPYIPGEYVKYNNNQIFVKEDSPDDPFNQMAQAFSHFTFERSWGHFLVNDLQGVGHLLTDPSIQTLNENKFSLNVTNLHEEGFKFFFAAHQCNSICRTLGLKTNAEMVMSGKYEFRERWPTMDPTVCCSNKLCRRIIRLASAHRSDKFPSHHWCTACWPQLQSTMARWICVAPGPNHEFDVSRFFYESQGQVTPRRCPEHIEKDTAASSAAVVGGSLWNKMKSEDKKGFVSGRMR